MVIKVVDYCIRIGITFVRKKLDFHAYDFLSLEGPQLAGLSARAWLFECKPEQQISLQVFGKHLASIWQVFGKYLASILQLFGKCLVKILE